MLGNRGNIAIPVVGVVVAAIVGIIGVKLFAQVNGTLTSAQLSTTGGLFDLTPLLLSALVVIGAVVAFLALVR